MEARSLVLTLAGVIVGWFLQLLTSEIKENVAGQPKWRQSNYQAHRCSQENDLVCSQLNPLLGRWILRQNKIVERTSTV